MTQRFMIINVTKERLRHEVYCIDIFQKLKNKNIVFFVSLCLGGREKC